MKRMRNRNIAWNGTTDAVKEKTCLAPYFPLTEQELPALSWPQIFGTVFRRNRGVCGGGRIGQKARGRGHMGQRYSRGVSGYGGCPNQRARRGGTGGKRWPLFPSFPRQGSLKIRNKMSRDVKVIQ
jgi:hypothetical protein